MFLDKMISRAAALLLAAGMVGLYGCASESAEGEADAAGDMPAAEAGMEGQAPDGMGEMGSPHGQVSVLMYTCADDRAFALTVAPGVGQAALRIEGESFPLQQQEAASGMEFSDGTYTFRGKGPEAYVEKDGEQIFSDCVASGHPEMAAPEGSMEPVEN